MNSDEWTESDIQALKAQEAKDLAIEFLSKLQRKERGPISPGEVQLQELEYELRLKEAEQEDQQAARVHEQRIKELELEIERERTQAAQVQQKANSVRQRLTELIDRVRQSEASLGVGLERAVREHRLRIEQLEHEYADRRRELEQEHQNLAQQRDELVERISSLTDLEASADDLAQLRDSANQARSELEHQKRLLDEELGNLEFDKTKRLTETQRSQDLELAKLAAAHEQAIVKLDRETADRILNGLGLQGISKNELDSLHRQIAEQKERIEQQAAEDRSQIREAFRREYNITMPEPIDVTDLFYQHRAAVQEIADLRKRIEKLDSEIARAREHIEKEPQRITAAVESARTQVQNIVEPATKR